MAFCCFPFKAKRRRKTGGCCGKAARGSVAVKVVVVGDGECGKSSLIQRYCSGTLPSPYNPTLFHTNTVHVTVQGTQVQMVIQDTAGQEDLDRLRRPFYLNTDVVVICFALDNPDSLDNVQNVWEPEVRRYCGKVPILLVANKADLVLNVARHGGCNGHHDVPSGHAGPFSNSAHLSVGDNTVTVSDVNLKETGAYSLSSDTVTHHNLENGGSNQTKSSSGQEYATTAGKVSSSRDVKGCAQINNTDCAEKDARLRPAAQKGAAPRDGCETYGRFHGTSSVAKKGQDLASELGSNGYFVNSAVLDVGVSEVFEAALAAAMRPANRAWRKKAMKQS